MNLREAHGFSRGSIHKRTRLDTTEEDTLGFRYARLEKMLDECDVIVIASPLTPETRGLFDWENISKMKRGAHLVNIARGAIADREAVVEALESGQLAGCAGDVWDEQPAPRIIRGARCPIMQ